MNEKNNIIQKIAIDNLAAHPGNPNRMSSGTFAKLVRNIERTGRYEPIVVRAVYSVPRSHSETPETTPHNLQTQDSRDDTITQNAERRTQSVRTPEEYEIINGHHRVKALKKLGHKTADCLVWDIDDNEADILLATLNRLAGTDQLDKKLALLRRLGEKTRTKELAKLLPHNARQIERLINLKPPKAPAQYDKGRFLNPLTFFVNDSQYEIIRRALSLACHGEDNSRSRACHGEDNSRSRAFHGEDNSRSRAEALTRIAEHFITRASQRSDSRDKSIRAKEHRSTSAQVHRSTSAQEHKSF